MNKVTEKDWFFCYPDSLYAATKEQLAFMRMFESENSFNHLFRSMMGADFILNSTGLNLSQCVNLLMEKAGMQTMSSTEYKIKVMQAHEDGAAIQKCIRGEWVSDSVPSWNWANGAYRVKPVEPKTIYANEYPEPPESEYSGAGDYYYCKAECVARAQEDAIRVAVEYKEVIKDA